MDRVPLAIASASTADIPTLVDLMREFYAESHYPLDGEWAASSFRRLLADPSRGGAWIARSAGEPAGHVVLALRHSMEFGGLAGVIDDLFVRPAFRRQGVGAALVRAVFEACQERQAAAIEVEVGTANVAAGRLYESFGLSPNDAGRRSLAIRLD
ncbi:MAG TPA: GNAT family N-acetyltransferase [Usitatibacter sp.]|nr:GNAT family N-acetyltransferase [Usitatibacter sp.]